MPPETILPFFQKYIESELGIVYAEHNAFQLLNRLEEISKLLDVKGIEQLFELAQKGIAGQFRQLLLDVATNNETSFFRDQKVFSAIEKQVLQSFLDSTQGKKRFKIWSAASSTGQEAMSLSILLNEYMKKTGTTFQFSILGTDISTRVLERAKKAEYTQLEVQRGLATPLLLKYFTKNQHDIWTVNTEITKNISFRSQNLKEKFSFAESFDLILCRNVLIYQSVQGKIEILKRITECLEPGGYLIMGSGESLMGLSDCYRQSICDGAVVYQKLDKIGAVA